MFSLLVTIIAIALVVLLVSAALYYGGSAFVRDSARLTAHTVVNQAEQIAAARQLAFAEGRSIPAGDAVQLPSDLMATMPVPPKDAYESGTPSAEDWAYYVPGEQAHFGLVKKINLDTCQALNRAQGFIGVPAAWDGVTQRQCFGTDDIGYTFLYELPSVKRTQHDQVVIKTVQDAKPTTPSVRPGYPRLCPDGTTIETGVCGPGAATPETTEMPAAKTDGFWVVTARASEYDSELENHGYAETCPAGGINPASEDARPAPSLPGEAFNADSVVEMDWEMLSGTLERTWCIPAREQDVPPGAVLGAEPNYGSVTDINQTRSATTDVLDSESWSMSSNTTTLLQAGGVTWTLLASNFEATTENLSTGSAATMYGRKLAIGKGSTATHTYFVNSPVGMLDDITLRNVSGMITFDPVSVPCLPLVPTAALGTGGGITQLLSTGYTSMLLKQDGSVWMAGQNNGGYGNCTTRNSETWTRVADNVSSISIGPWSTFIVRKDGSLWGAGEVQLGSVEYYNRFTQLVPSGVTNAGSGIGYVVFRKTDGSLWYAGNNVGGTAGTGTDEEYPTPVKIADNVTWFNATRENLLYLTSDRTLWATGQTSYYRMGYPGTQGDFGTNTPGLLPYKLAENVQAASASQLSIVYVKTDGTVYAAGTDGFVCGMFGKGVETRQLKTFTQIAPEIGPVVSVQNTNASIRLLGTDGRLWASGCHDGDFGDGTTDMRTVFTPIASNVKLYAGFLMIVDSSDTLWASGMNDDGNFGNGTLEQSLTFSPVAY